MWHLEAPPRILENVTFVQLRIFACAARTGSFAKAAELLEISPPAVSGQIKTLEQRLGRSLFHRRKGATPTLTTDGEHVLECVEKIFAIGKRMLLPDATPASKALLRVSVGSFLREHYFKSLMFRIYDELPHIDLDLYPETSPAEAIRMVENGELDFAIYALPRDAQIPPHSRQICELPLIMVGPPGTNASLLTGERSLDDFKFIFPVRREVGARWAKKLLRELGLKPRTSPRFVEFVDVVVKMVENGDGIGHVMAYAVADKVAAGRLEVLEIPLSPMRRLITRSPYAADGAEELEAFLCEALSAPGRPLSFL